MLTLLFSQQLGINKNYGQKGQFKVLSVEGFKEAVREDLYIKPCEHSSCLFLIKLLFCHAKIVLLEASAVLVCLTGPYLCLYPVRGQGMELMVLLNTVPKPAQCQYTLARPVVHPRHDSCLTSMRFPWSMYTSELLKSLLTFHSNSGCRIWFFSFPVTLHWALSVKAVLCLSVTFLL